MGPAERGPVAAGDVPLPGAAFIARPRIPGSATCRSTCWAWPAFAILGLANPAFWLLGLGVEAAYLSMTASNRRFRERRRRRGPRAAPGRQRPRLGAACVARTLRRRARRRLAASWPRSARPALYGQFHADDFLASGRTASRCSRCSATMRGCWRRGKDRAPLDGRRRRAAAARSRLCSASLSGPGMTEELRTSRMRTLEIVQARLENQKRSEPMGEEIESELQPDRGAVRPGARERRDEQPPQAISSDLAIDLTQARRRASSRCRRARSPRPGGRGHGPGSGRATDHGRRRAEEGRTGAAPLGARAGRQVRERRRLPVHPPRQRPRPPAGAGPRRPDGARAPCAIPARRAARAVRRRSRLRPGQRHPGREAAARSSRQWPAHAGRLGELPRRPARRRSRC